MLKMLGIVMPIAMLAAIVLTANHYILDAIAGGALVLLSVAAVTWLPRQIDRLTMPEVQGRRRTVPPMTAASGGMANQVAGWGLPHERRTSDHALQQKAYEVSNAGSQPTDD